MTMQEVTELELRFRDTMGSLRTLRVRNPKDSITITAAEVRTAMESILVANPFIHYSLQSLDSARYVTRVVEGVDINE